MIWIYLSGVAVTWIVCKWARNNDGVNEWKLVFVSLLLSLISWPGLVVLLVVNFEDEIKAFFKKAFGKPPKWL